eukprot:g10793.t1
MAASQTSATASSRHVVLPNAPSSGFQMPRLLLGTWKAEVGQTKQAVIAAVRDGGYRGVDTANDYGNEHEVGEAITYLTKTSASEEGRNGEPILKREELFVQCKLWNANMRPDLVRGDLIASLQDLQLDYVDKESGPCYYCSDNGVHFTDTWKAMERLVDEGLARSIGISNFNCSQVMDLLKNGCVKYKPAVLQNEVHLYLQQKDTLDFCRKHGIQLQAYSPLGSVYGGTETPTGDRDLAADAMFRPEYSIREHPTLTDIGKRYGGKSPAQVAMKRNQVVSYVAKNCIVALRYQLQRGVCLVAKSVNPGRIVENGKIFGTDFPDLTTEEMGMISDMNCNWRGLLWPQTAGHPDYPFRETTATPAKVPSDWLFQGGLEELLSRGPHPHDDDPARGQRLREQSSGSSLPSSPLDIRDLEEATAEASKLVEAEEQDTAFPWFHMVQWAAENAPASCVFRWDLEKAFFIVRDCVKTPLDFRESLKELKKDREQKKRSWEGAEAREEEDVEDNGMAASGSLDSVEKLDGFSLEDQEYSLVFIEWAEALLTQMAALRRLRDEGSGTKGNANDRPGLAGADPPREPHMYSKNPGDQAPRPLQLPDQMRMRDAGGSSEFVLSTGFQTGFGAEDQTPVGPAPYMRQPWII